MRAPAAFLSQQAADLTGVAGWMADLIDRFGSPGVGLVVALENVFPPIPSEAVLPAAGYLAGTGRLDPAAVLIWSTIGSVVGALVLYALGMLVGADRIAGIAGRLPLMSENDVLRAWRAFDRWDRRAVFFGRLVPGVRSLISIPAGARRMPLVPFLLYTGVGSALWNALLIGAGWWLGDRWGETAAVSRVANVLVVVVVVGLVLWLILTRFVRRARGRATG